MTRPHDFHDELYVLPLPKDTPPINPPVFTPPVNAADDVFAFAASASTTADEIALIKATILAKYGFEVTDAYAADLIAFVGALTTPAGER